MQRFEITVHDDGRVSAHGTTGRLVLIDRNFHDADGEPGTVLRATGNFDDAARWIRDFIVPPAPAEGDEKDGEILPSGQRVYELTAERVRDLREITGGSLQDCRLAVERSGSQTEAIEFVRSIGIGFSGRSSCRCAEADKTIEILIPEDGLSGAVQLFEAAVEFDDLEVGNLLVIHLYREHEDPTCPKCGGSGGGGEPYVQCDLCKGSGEIDVAVDEALEVCTCGSIDADDSECPTHGVADEVERVLDDSTSDAPHETGDGPPRHGR